MGKRMSWTSIAMAGSMLVGLSGATIQAQAASQPVTITMAFWGDQTRADDINNVVTAFEKKYPNIKVNAQYEPFSGYFDKLNTEIATGSAPDVFALGGNINTYADQGSLLNLNPYVGKALNTKGMPQSILAYNTFSGHLEGIPTGLNAFGIIADQTMFQKAGLKLPKDNWNWQDFARISEQIHKKLGDGFYGSYNGSSDDNMIGEYLGGQKIVLYDQATNKVGLTEPVTQVWFSFWNVLQKTGAIVPPDLATANANNAGTSLIETGKVAMVSQAANQLSSYQPYTKDHLVLLPPPNGPKAHGASVSESQLLAVSAKSKHPKEAAEFINFFVNDPAAVKAMGTNIGVPDTSTMRNYLMKFATPADKALYTYVNLVGKWKAPLTYNIPNVNQWDTDISNISGQLQYGQITSQQAAQQLVADAKQLVSSNQ